MTQPAQYLIDTNIVSELRRHKAANPGVRRFFIDAARQQIPLFLSPVGAAVATELVGLKCSFLVE
jgi:hypothetical protein